MEFDHHGRFVCRGLLALLLGSLFFVSRPSWLCRWAAFLSSQSLLMSSCFGFAVKDLVPWNLFSWTFLDAV